MQPAAPLGEWEAGTAAQGRGEAPTGKPRNWRLCPLGTSEAQSQDPRVMG